MKKTLLAFALFFCSDLLAGTGWSIPLTLSPATSTTPYIATDLQSNSVAIWYDNGTTPGTLMGATLKGGALNFAGQPQWILTNQVGSNVIFPNPASSLSSPLGMTPNGDAYVTWSDQNNDIWVSSLPSGQQIWNTPVLLNTSNQDSVSNPTLSIAPNGNIVVVWTNQSQLLCNSYDYVSGIWQGQSPPIPIQNGLSENQVVVDNFGNALLILSEADDNCYVYAFNFSQNSWTSISPLITGPNSCSSIGVDLNGNGTLISVSGNGTVSAAYLPFGSPVFINQQTLSLTGQNNYSLPVIQMDPNGNALAIWTEASGDIAAAKYSSANGNWNLLSPLSTLGTPSNLALAMDGLGNILLSWTLLTPPSSTGTIQVAAIAANHTNWQMISTISQGLNNERNQQLTITVLGDAVAVWEDDVNSTTGNIESSVFTGLFAPPETLVPVNFKGQVLYSRLLKNTDSTHRLTWENNPNPVIESYILLRNGSVVATFDASYLYYTFDDNGRTGSQDNYTIFSLTSTNVVSIPLSVVLP